MKKQEKTIQQKNAADITLEGLMNFGQLENGRRVCDFQSTDAVMMEPFSGKCRLQVMRNGSAYITELKKKRRGKPLFRLDHSSLSLGQNDVFYFVLMMPKEQIDKLAETLVWESGEAAMKVVRMLRTKGGNR